MHLFLNDFKAKYKKYRQPIFQYGTKNNQTYMISLISKKLKYTHLIKINESMRKFNRRVKERNRNQARQSHQGNHRSRH